MIIPIELRFKADKDSKSVFRTEKTIKSHDVNSVEFHISIEGLELTNDLTAKILSVFHSSKSQANVDCEIVEGKIIYKPDTNLISRHEHVTNYVYVYHNNQSLDVREFIYVVDLSKIDETSLEVKEVYDQSYADLLADFEQALSDYKDSLPQADSVRADIDEMLNQFGVDSQAILSLINEAESSRVQAEGQRESAESSRVQSETQRVSAESNRVNAEAQRVLAENERSDKYENYAQQFNDVILDLSEEKDYHSLPEISAARGGHDTLGARLDDTTAQLAQKAKKSEVRKDTATQPIDVDEMNTRTKQLFTGGAVAVVGENAVGSENIKTKAVTKEKTSFSNEIFGSSITMPNTSDDFTKVNAVLTNIGSSFNFNKVADGYGWVTKNGSKKIKVTIRQTSAFFIALRANDTEALSVSIVAPNAGRVAKTTVTTLTTLINESTVTKKETVAIGDEVMVEYDGTIVTATVKKAGTSSFVPYFEVDLTSIKATTDSISDIKFGLMVFAGGNIGGIETSIQGSIEQKADEAYKQSLDTQVIPYKTLKWSVGGDSISANTGGAYGENYPTIIGRELEFRSVDNKAVGGTRIARLEGAYQDVHALSERYQLYDADADIVTIFAGTNDYQGQGVNGVPIGVKGSTDKYEFYGALKILIEGLITKYPHGRIGFITPLRRTNDTVANLQGHKLIDYVDAIIDMCNDYSIPVLDLHRNGGLNRLNSSVLTTDGLHPNATGNLLIAHKIKKFVESL